MQLLVVGLGFSRPYGLQDPPSCAVTDFPYNCGGMYTSAARILSTGISGLMQSSTTMSAISICVSLAQAGGRVAAPTTPDPLPALHQGETAGGVDHASRRSVYFLEGTLPSPRWFHGPRALTRLSGISSFGSALPLAILMSQPLNRASCPGTKNRAVLPPHPQMHGRSPLVLALAF